MLSTRDYREHKHLSLHLVGSDLCGVPCICDTLAKMTNQQKRYACLLGLGACILIYRTVAMIRGGALTILQSWVAGLLVLEFLVDVMTLCGCIQWFRIGDVTQATLLPLSFGACATFLHAFRVCIFVLGRLERFQNFDVRPEFHADHDKRWNWKQVYVASILSIFGILGVFLIRLYRRRRVSMRDETKEL